MQEVKFDDWWKKHNCVKDSLSYNDAMYVYESRQQEVDNLQHRVGKLQTENDELQNDLIKAAEGQMKLFEHNNELQKRIDELKAWCIIGVECGMISTTYNQALIDMLKILKGD